MRTWNMNMEQADSSSSPFYHWIPVSICLFLGFTVQPENMIFFSFLIKEPQRLLLKMPVNPQICCNSCHVLLQSVIIVCGNCLRKKHHYTTNVTQLCLHGLIPFCAIQQQRNNVSGVAKNTFI